MAAVLNYIMLAYRRVWVFAVLLFFGFTLRIFEIGEPLIDKQAWRQADTAAVARNFFEEDFDISSPRVDWRGNGSGVVEMNFPLYPYLVSLGYETLGGVHEWLGRLLSAFFSVLTSIVLFFLVRNIGFSSSVGLWAMFFFLVTPLSVFFGRAFLPESLMLLLSVSSILTFKRWTESEQIIYYLCAVLLAPLCYLVKIPTLYLGFPLVAIALSQWGWKFIYHRLLWVYLFVSLLPSAIWYLHASDLFADTGLTFGIWNRYGYDKWDQSVLYDLYFYRQMSWRFLHNIFTPFGMLLLILGVFKTGLARSKWVLWGWFLGLLLYMFLVPEGNRKLHYYQIPFVPLGCIWAGVGTVTALDSWDRVRKSKYLKSIATMVLAFSVLTYSVHAVQPYYNQPNNVHEYYESCYDFGQWADKNLPKDALLVVGDLDENSGTPFRSQSPTMLYYCHRKGWQITPDEFSEAKLDSLASLGADFFVVAGGFVLQKPEFWKELLGRGVSTTDSYPGKWYDSEKLQRHISQSSSRSRHFIIVKLIEDNR
ncbi:MAG: glycosyltransferase family 39 protein [Candidatus Latescibacterota bacterium]|nr:glycosyltransferase family 39 protein [Candidatus Latescibacterota bacterium]